MFKIGPLASAQICIGPIFFGLDWPENQKLTEISGIKNFGAFPAHERLRVDGEGVTPDSLQWFSGFQSTAVADVDADADDDADDIESPRSIKKFWSRF